MISPGSDAATKRARTFFSGGWWGALLVIAIVWLFLRSLRCSLIVASIIPLALLTAFIGLQMIHLPANLISMGAVDFGILVDGAVVLVENAYRLLAHGQRDESRLQIVRRASLEVAKPISFAILIIIVVFLPLFSLTDIEGKLFKPMALAITFAMVGALA